MKSLLFYFIILTSIIFSYNIEAQPIHLKVKKGLVKFKDKYYTETNPYFELKAGESVVIASGDIVLGRIGTSYFEINKGNTYTYEGLKKSKTTYVDASPSLMGFLFGYSLQNTKNNYGNTTRGFDKKSDFYSPSDTLFEPIILNDSFQLEIGNDFTKLISEVTLKKQDNDSIIYNAIPDKKIIKLANLEPGNYIWSYKIEYPEANKITESEFENIFIIPEANRKTELYSDYIKIYSELKTLKSQKRVSEDLYNILLQEYKSDKKIYVNE